EGCSRKIRSRKIALFKMTIDYLCVSKIQPLSESMLDRCVGQMHPAEIQLVATFHLYAICVARVVPVWPRKMDRRFILLLPLIPRHCPLQDGLFVALSHWVSFAKVPNDTPTGTN